MENPFAASEKKLEILFQINPLHPFFVLFRTIIFHPLQLHYPRPFASPLTVGALSINDANWFQK